MLARLLTTLCLAALAACVDEEPYPILHSMGKFPVDHITVSAKLSSADLELKNGPLYLIPSGSCSGYLDTDLLCGKEVVKGVEVTVYDPNDFATVKILKKQGRVVVLRRGVDQNLFCPGKALVDLRLTCEHYKFSHSRNRLRLPSLLESDSSESESSESSEEDESEEDEGASV